MRQTPLAMENVDAIAGGFDDSLPFGARTKCLLMELKRGTGEMNVPDFWWTRVQA